MNLANKTAFITGGSSGLGLALAKRFLEAGAKVVATGRSQESSTALEEIDSSNLIVEYLDVQNFHDIEKIVAKYQSIDILINNAGIYAPGKMGEVGQALINQTIATNLTGSISLVNLVVPQMKMRKTGHIINIVSTSGLKARAEQSIYVASKFGLRGFTDAIREEVSGDGITVIGVYPGGMNTNFYSRTDTGVDAHTWMDPTEVADTIIYTLTHDTTQVIDHIVINRRKSNC